MRARVIKTPGGYQLLTCTGRICKVSLQEVYAFFMQWNDPRYFEGSFQWDYEVSMEEYPGETIFFVDESNQLTVTKPEHLQLLLSTANEFVNAKEYAALHGRGEGIVRRYCRMNRIQGAIRVGSIWLIPRDAEYPESQRWPSEEMSST